MSNFIGRFLFLLGQLMIAFTINGQSLQVSFIKITPEKENFDTNDSTISFPIFSFTSNANLSNNVNAILQKDLNELYDISEYNDVRSLLEKCAKEGLVQLEYNELRNDKSILSFYIAYEHMVAYPVYWEKTYCFSKRTGNLLTIDSLVTQKKKTALLAFAKTMYIKDMKAYREEMHSEFRKGEITAQDYNYILEQTKDNCWHSFSASNFKLYKGNLEIIIDCDFPRIYRPLTPPSRITINEKYLREFFKPKYLN